MSMKRFPQILTVAATSIAACSLLNPSAQAAEITWDAALNDETRWGPDNYEFGPLPVDPVPMPGQRRR